MLNQFLLVDGYPSCISVMMAWVGVVFMLTAGVTKVVGVWTVATSMTSLWDSITDSIKSLSSQGILFCRAANRVKDQSVISSQSNCF